MRPTVSFVLGIALVIVAMAPSPTQAQAQGPVYIVQEGDTLIAIADRFGPTVDEIAEANNLADPSLLFPGMELLIPGFPGVSGVLETRTVQFGENLASLRWRYGVPTEALIRLNRVVNPQRVYAGEEWVVPVSDRDGPTGFIQTAEPGRGLLQSGAAAGLGAWGASALREDPFRRWLVPGELWVHPGMADAILAIPFPVAGVELDPTPVLQGQTATLRLRLSAAAEIQSVWDGRELNFHETGEMEFVALQGIHALAQPGLVEVELSLTSDEGRTIRYRQSVRVDPGGYGFDPVLYVPAETLDPDFTAPEDEQIRSLVTQVTSERLWMSEFQPPSVGGFTSLFGSRRNYNNTGYLYYHTGLDFSGRTGTPILAPARGRVVFAGPLQVRGNTTYIDHGWGVFTGYFHQSEILVAAGQMVQVGDDIGLVGGTGRATGPHLHWEVWVNGVPVDPVQWLEEVFP